MENVLYPVLERALRRRRGHGSTTEAKFVAWLVRLLAERVTMIDGSGNVHCDMRNGNKTRTLFAAHTDTVHWTTGKNWLKKTATHYEASGAPLGADDGAGCAILCHLIEHGIPGYYIFTRGEEEGGIGSNWIEENMSDLLQEFDRAIMFDRRGTSDVVHEMGVGETASLDFADALCEQLNDRGMLYMPSDEGSFTDCANWIEHIPECCNISCGYMNEHSSRESLLIEHFDALAQAALTIEWEKLPVIRTPVPPYTKSRWSNWKDDKDDKDDKYENPYTNRGASNVSHFPTTHHDTAGVGITTTCDEQEDWGGTLGWENYGNGSVDDIIDKDLTRALANAELGRYTELFDMAAEHACPQDPDIALKMMTHRHFSNESFDRVYDVAYDRALALEEVFDIATGTIKN